MILEKLNFLDQPAHGACSLINTECLKSLGGYNEKFKSQDGVDIWIKLLIQKYKIKNINFPLFYYRQHEENLTKNKLKLFKSRDKIFDIYQKKKQKFTNTICIILLEVEVKRLNSIKKISSKTCDRKTKSINIIEKIKKIIVSSLDQNILKFINKKYKKKS